MVKVVTQAELSLLIAKNPRASVNRRQFPQFNLVKKESCLRRSKAIRSAWGETQLVKAEDPTLLWKPVIPEKAIQRRWQSHPSEPPVPEQTPAPEIICQPKEPGVEITWAHRR